MYTTQDRRSHQAGLGLVRPAKPAPTALDRLHEIMRADANLARKSAEALVMQMYPEFVGAF